MRPNLLAGDGCSCTVWRRDVPRLTDNPQHTPRARLRQGSNPLYIYRELLEDFPFTKQGKLLQKLLQSGHVFLPSDSPLLGRPSHILLFSVCMCRQKIPELGQSGLNQYHCEFYCTPAIHSVSNQARLYPHPLPAPQPNQTHICRQSARNYP